MAEGRRVTAADLELSGLVEPSPARTLKEVREEAERAVVGEALRRHNGKISAAALELGVSRPTLYELMERLGMGKDS
jgi:two-component system NtrC family response regulator